MLENISLYGFTNHINISCVAAAAIKKSNEPNCYKLGAIEMVCFNNINVSIGSDSFDSKKETS